MASIKQLSPSVVNKIAAGEVIERPASVVKELLENAIDAQARRIDVSIERGGADLIRISDDGCGIRAEELPLAIAPHATSKIRDSDDLFHVETLGFRGEALASIAEISRLVLRSRPADIEGRPMGAAQIDINGGVISEVSPCAGSLGTTVEVRDLFFNTPVRRKFLRSTQTELAHISEAFLRIALANPQLHFTLRHNDRQVFDLPPSDPWLARIHQCFGPELAEQLIWIESQDAEVRLWGYAAHPSQSRGHQRMQYLFLNGRYVRDRSLQHALAEAYRGLLMVGRYPIVFLCIAMPPQAVDVNVHPTKLEVRFQDSGRLYSQLLGTLRTRFLTADLSNKLDSSRAAGAPSANDSSNDSSTGRRAEVVAWAKSLLPAGGPVSANSAYAPHDEIRPSQLSRQVAFALDEPPQSELKLVPIERPAAASPDILGTRPAASFAPPQHAVESPSATTQPHDGVELQSESSAAPFAHRTVPTQRSVSALQVHQRYLVFECDEGMVVVDQHALHERILYERLRSRIDGGTLEAQRLLVPEPVDLSGPEAAVLAEHKEVLTRLGVETEPFGGNTVLVTSSPAMLPHVQPAEIVRGLVELLLNSGRTPEPRDVLDNLLNMLACKGAIKAGDPLTGPEIEALLEQRHLVDDAHHCPHGRPTALVLTRDQLDKQFQRT